MISVLELQLGARASCAACRQNSGLYAYDERAGACILLNAVHPRDRRAQTGGHELGHFVSTRRVPDAPYAGSSESSREERCR